MSLYSFKIRFKARPFEALNMGSPRPPLLVRLPKNASSKLPSRGIVMIRGTFNSLPFRAVCEPDGQGSHWFKVRKNWLKNPPLQKTQAAFLEIEPSKEWTEPKVPTDFKQALAKDPKIQNFWQSLTPMARWDWIRWISSAKQQDTRTRRVEVACSKLKAGKKRPCCFDRTQCTLTDA